MGKDMKQYKKLMPQINSLIKKLANFDPACEAEDYMQEAILGLLEAKNKYRKAPNGARTRMQEEVYEYYHIANHLNKLASSSGDVAYEVFRADGEYIRTISNNEFRKKKRALAVDGYVVRPVRLVESLYRTDNDGKEIEIQISGGVNGFQENGNGADDDDFDRN